ncbi:endonuclease/exonuclease/phosphatase family metal-dependent hydrolase [Pontibacter aydingkolensis]|uniref:Endonuclease/exonuclease/phosphatase family protein n=1 Tax=Pontibacter aydingkolensis TaxID=1911536 RepID=A0ABS7CS52_9BACT|nr:endonuclease/exonuclease/phosphatase family protein [Pontibacter aydingkolensis]MBW7466618.1 endonuclease/exonuclease/phosphatase family protein [Pontibacter aydingkolensis]
MAATFKTIRRRVWLILNTLVVLWLLLGVICLQVPPESFWPAAFIAFSLPAPLVLNFLFLLYWLLRRSWLVVLPLSVFILGWGYYARLVSVNFAEEVSEGTKTLQVLSFNTHVFNAYADKDGSELEASTDMIDWVATHPADIICLQEFYSNRGSSTYNTISKIGTRYDRYRFFSVSYVDRNKADIGSVIFSKYPIINKGVIRFGESHVNRAIWTDIDMKGDTIRVYSAHLQSMSIKSQDIESTYSAIGNEESFKKEGRNLARRLKRGFVARGNQVELLLEHIRESPYPVIVCGDFNDIPFSYTYNQMAKELKNAFVKAGSGVGATYNGPLPFLRIDNQFYSEALKAYEFETHYEMGLSDHFPISAKYVLQPKAQE